MKHPKIQVYKARDGWRWRLEARNGRIVLDGGEAYTRQHDATRAVWRAVAVFRDAIASPNAGIEVQS